MCSAKRSWVPNFSIIRPLNFAYEYFGAKISPPYILELSYLKFKPLNFCCQYGCSIFFNFLLHIVQRTVTINAEDKEMKREPSKYEKTSQERIIYLIKTFCNGSQQEFANRVGIGKSSVSQYVNGANFPSNLRAGQIAEAFGINPVWVAGYDAPMKKTDFSNIANLSTPDAYAVPVLGRICCGDGTFTEDSYDGYFVLDKSIRADFCLEARGSSMTDAGIDDGDKVFIRKSEHYEDGKIYGIIIKGEDLASLKKVYRLDGKIMLQPCNSDYHPQIVSKDDVYIIGECVGVYKVI